MVRVLEKKYNFKGQVVLITGGGSGIGKIAAAAFVAAGAHVVIAGRDQVKLKKAASDITQTGGVCSYIIVDVANIASAKALVKKVVFKFSRIDILVNCAGVYGPIGQLHENLLKEWSDTLSINLLGTVNVVHEVLPVMLKQKKGKIINLSGGGAVQPFPNFSAYATSKAAIVRFTETVAKEYESKNIHINAIAPGAINTIFLEKVLLARDKAGKDFYEKSLNQKKTGGDSPKAAAGLMLFLCSPRAGNLTGKLVSAKWDLWKNFTPEKISGINKSSELTLRRIDNKYFKATDLHE